MRKKSDKTDLKIPDTAPDDEVRAHPAGPDMIDFVSSLKEAK